MRTRTKIRSAADKQGGIALLEALISVLLLSLGIIALVSMQAAMSKNVTQTKLRGEAAFLANQLIGQMWVDKENLSNYAATAESGCTADESGNCANWYAAVQQLLPGGTADVVVNGNAVTIMLNWALPGEDPSSYQIDALINS